MATSRTSWPAFLILTDLHLRIEAAIAWRVATHPKVMPVTLIVGREAPFGSDPLAKLHPVGV